jgi:hypothetical protein
MSETICSPRTDHRDLTGAPSAAQIERVLDDVATAESWECMALRSVARSTPHHGEPVPGPFAGAGWAA